METAQTDEHAYLKQLLENSPDGVFTIGTDLLIRYVNPAFCKMLGYRADILQGSSITDHLGDLNILGVCMANVESEGHCNDQETIFKRADGSVVHISKNVQAIYDGQNQIREILVTLRDLTQLHGLNRRLEESLQEREQANMELQTTLNTLRETQKQLVHAEKMAALGGLVAGMAHEINTPLGIGVTSASSIHEETVQLSRNLESDSIKRSDLERYLQQTAHLSEIMLKNLRRAADMVNSFKQVAVDQSSDEWRDISLGAYIEEILVSLHPRLKQSRLVIETDCHPDLELFTNPGAIYQIASNLVINAITHAFDPGQDGKMTVRARKTDEGCQLVFSDNGKGIQPEHIERIFEPFFTTRRGQGGSGLGLNILYNLVTGALKGRVRVESTPGNGTAFYIDIPTISKQMGSV